MLIHSWRWFGPHDPITLDQVVQTGAVSVVTALHQIPVGETWPAEEIRDRRMLIERSGLSWGVVESVPVHEEIKKRSGRFRQYTENYRRTLRNLGKEGIRTVCFNFMPALDWSRTNLATTGRDGSEVSGFNYMHFAVVDLFILKRPGADGSYPEETLRQAEAHYSGLSQAERKTLQQTFLLGFPGSGESFSLTEVLHRLEGYAGLDNDAYRVNLAAFLQEIVPAAESAGVQLAIHPDDPPWPLLGLPRAVSTLQDAEEIIRVADTPVNGLTFCTGSFGAAATNDLPVMAERLAHRINFLHIRNVSRDRDRNFQESNLLEGDVDIHRIMRTMVLEDLRRSENRPGYAGIPLRPDHGSRILGDFQATHYPGYSLYGRLKNLAEIRGLEWGIRKNLADGNRER